LEFHLGRGTNVHFLLVDLNLNEIAEKVNTGNVFYITAKELRWLYRHRQVAQVKEQLHFWYPDREVPQDEVWVNSTWNNYDPKNNPIDLKRTERTPPPPPLSVNPGDSFLSSIPNHFLSDESF
jgi:hypothetical protein